MARHFTLAAFLLSLAAFCGACSSNSDTPEGGAGGTTGGETPDAASDSPGADAEMPDAGGDAAQEDGVSTVDASPDAGVPDAQPDHGLVGSCGDIGAADCFGNNECASADRCENVGDEANPVPCCVPGVRGTGTAGDACVSENDCDSGVCVAGNGASLCSKTCATADDCPATMKDCTYIAFSGSNDAWCLPTK